MRIKSVLTPFVLAAVTLALAQTAGPVAHGRGAARSEDNRRAEFDFEVGRRTIEGQLRPVGRFVLETTDPNVTGFVRIRMPKPDEVMPDGAIARFAGPGDIRFKPKNGPVVERVGRVRVMVRDNRPPRAAANSTPDRIAVQFTSPGAEGRPPLTYTFEGNVVNGDIVVRR